MSLVLASTSPRRHSLLKSLGLDFSVFAPSVDEVELSGEGGAEMVKRLAALKAVNVAQNFTNDWVLGADTCVEINGKVLGKPEDRSAAREMLELLSGKEHTVFTAWHLCNLSLRREHFYLGTTYVTFTTLSPLDIERYISSSEPYDKAGGYAAQGKAGWFVSSITGSLTNLIGLDICSLAIILKSEGIL
jgi:septum formation protein